MIKIALPNKGQLMPPAIELLSACGYRAQKPSRSLSSLDSEHGIEFYFLRPGDIPVYVAEGILDAGVTGQDFVAEKEVKPEMLLELDFGHSKMCAAVPKTSLVNTIKELAPQRIATSFPVITRNQIKGAKHLVELEGAVEISVKLGIADAIVDVVATGNTLRQAGLKIIDEPLFRSQAALFANPKKAARKEFQKLVSRLQGILVAQKYVMIEYDTPAKILEKVCQLTPGIESPTVTPLKAEGWFSVKSMIKKSESNAIMDKLSEMGCKGILMTRIESARI